MGDDPDDEEPSRRGPIIAIAVIVALVLATAYVGYRLRDAGHIQDCVAAGRSNCAPIEVPVR